MAANEISERLAASCWLRLEPTGAVPGQAAPATLTFRSMVGFTQQIMTAVNLAADGLILLFTDRELSRRETTVHVTFPFTVRNAQRDNYPDIGGALGAICQPFHTNWIGNPLAPSWRPFELGQVVPAGLDLDRYNGVALRITDVDNVSDICLTILEHPRWDGSVTVLNIIPNVG